MSDWQLYEGSGTVHDGIARLPAPPRWRAFDATAGQPHAALDHPGWSPGDLIKGASYRAHADLLAPVNAALYLRRPLLVTGQPGVGKSTLAYSIAYELGLRPVLRWSITSSSTLKDSLYRYDAIGRLQDVSMKLSENRTSIGRYLRLGPLGTALLPSDTPRVLLIDEIDKADIDLPNDLLSAFEEGEYEIPELARMADQAPEVMITTADGTEPAQIRQGRVRCRQFPLVVMTNNAEREFPGAFLRRCLRLDIERPNAEQLTQIVEAQLEEEVTQEITDLIGQFEKRAAGGELATDQLLNAIQLTCRTDLDPAERAGLLKLLLRYLSPEPA
ncbi:MAG TPA: MoxR family ATPase [Streptosporangiaceae bacterium]|nr:MoxR family ATPase [Streptosporangiaceae bacterium]